MRKVCLVTTYYKETNPERRKELELSIDLNSAVFDEVHVVSEDDIDTKVLPIDCKFHLRSKRPTFADIFHFVSSLPELNDSTIAISNCDIIFTPKAVNHLRWSMRPDQAWCLTRWELHGKNPMKIWDVPFSQDAWCFQTPLKEKIKECGNYFFGVPGCDNKIAFELHTAGYEVLNPSLDVQTWHLHATAKRTSTNTEQNRVNPPYMYIPPSTLEQDQVRVPVATLKDRPKAKSQIRKMKKWKK